MKIGHGVRANKSVNPSKNDNKKTLIILCTTAVTILLIIWVFAMGRKAEETVSVIMLDQSVYKNQALDESMLKEYQMLKAEFDKFAIEQQDGTYKRRYLLWEERDKVIGWFAAYPLQADSLLDYRSIIRSRTDNSDTVLYSFPGKDIIQLDLGDQDLKSFKTYLEPGDRLNVTAVYTEEEQIQDEMGNRTTVETVRTADVFQDIMLADLLNSQGGSILDIYADYNTKTVVQQAILDQTESFQDSVEPKTMLIAVTPEEKRRYYKYTAKKNVTFRISLPQRVE